LFHVPFLGWHLWTSGNFPIDRGDARKTARSLKTVVDGLRAGKSLAVFAEGTGTPEGRLQGFKAGPSKIAVRAGVPVVPVTIRGTFALLPKTALAPRPGRVDVFIGEPIATTGRDDKQMAELIDAVKDAIQANLGSAPRVAARSPDARPGS